MGSRAIGPRRSEEEWRPVKGWPGYEVSSMGRLGSWLKSPNEAGPPKSRRILIGGVDRDGYRRAVLVRRSGRASMKFHSLVLIAFIGKKPFPGAVCRHLNGVVTDNRPSNLRWGTVLENIADRDSGPRAVRRVSLAQEAEIRALRGRETQAKIAKAFGISAPTVCVIQQGRPPRSSS